VLRRPVELATPTVSEYSRRQADDLELVARVQNQAISDVIRATISDRIEQAKKDPSFQDGLRDRIERAQRLLGRR
jgi:hypothetical protein